MVWQGRASIDGAVQHVDPQRESHSPDAVLSEEARRRMAVCLKGDYKVIEQLRRAGLLRDTDNRANNDNKDT